LHNRKTCRHAMVLRVEPDLSVTATAIAHKNQREPQGSLGK
jgi:hypothetical protein